MRSDEVIDLMIKEYPTKHSEYSVILQERERQRITKEYSVSTQSAVRTIYFRNPQTLAKTYSTKVFVLNAAGCDDEF